MLCSPLEAREGKNLYYAVPSSDTEIKKKFERKKTESRPKIGYKHRKCGKKYVKMPKK